jgi:ribosomal protein L14E/L6E/L27E
MFILSSEKEKINEGITLLCAEVAKLKTEIIFLTAKIKVSEEAKVTPKKQTTAAQKAKQREYMRKYTARKRAEKKAQA